MMLMRLPLRDSSGSGLTRLLSLLLRGRAMSEELEAEREWAGEGSPLRDRCLDISGRGLLPPAPLNENIPETFP